ncbi:MAG TPA: hypothetical protein VFE23_05440 [Usitatibacter sp.]|jgi:hypothetical protein|nr:hypothetical protein [Usitatibacter sp.]
MQGAADPGVALVQAAANILPNATGAPSAVNQRVAQENAQYENARADAGRGGFDAARMLGNVAVTAPVPMGSTAATSLLGTAGKGALQGAAGNALQPVEDTSGGYWKQKLKDAATGALVGGIAAPAVNALARVVSPNASVNPNLKLLTDEGVQPTIGQTLGGAFNTANMMTRCHNFTTLISIPPSSTINSAS